MSILHFANLLVTLQQFGGLLDSSVGLYSKAQFSLIADRGTCYATGHGRPSQQLMGSCYTRIT